MTKNIIIAILSVFLLISLFVSRIQKMRADNMTRMVEQKQQESEQLRIVAQHARLKMEEALKEAAFQREQAIQQVALLEAKLQKSGRRN